MRDVHNIEFRNGTKEELIADIAPDFPYTASYVRLDKYSGRFVPWHWHKAVELFYMESGGLEYGTPQGQKVFPAGTGGFVNSNVLHMTRPRTNTENNIQFVQLFDTSLIAGEQGSRIEKNYITPIITAPQIEIIALQPDNPHEKQLLSSIREAFQMPDAGFGYEIRLRALLSEIWLELFRIAIPLLEEKRDYGKINDKIKSMLLFIHERYQEKITIAEVAAAAYLSERECFRVFHDCLHITPAEYIKNYRLQMACHMLAKSKETITYISHACGLGSSSYFGKVFKEQEGCTPIEYRSKWQDIDS